MNTEQAKGRLALLYACFFLSGIAGLIYEVIWSRYLALFVGSTGEAHIIVLATYMGGLALGAWLFGRAADKVANPLKLYVALEAGIAAFGYIYPAAFEPVRGLFIELARSTGAGNSGSHIGAIVAASLTLLIPTTLMGGTLPVLGRYLIRGGVSVGQGISKLYFLNSLGAVFGALIAGTYLARTFGLKPSLHIAATMNLLVVALGLLMLRFKDDAAFATAESGAATTTSSPEYSTEAARIATIVIGVSGFVSMVYEVAWIRLLTLVLGSSSYSFSVMLAAFIFGIACGSYILSRKKTETGYYRILGWCEVAIGLTALISVMFYERLPVVLNQWRHILSSTPEAFSVYEFVKFAFCFLVMVVPTVFMGATLPAASRVVTDSNSTLGRRIGTLFAINTAGTVLGAAIAGFRLLPVVGIRHSIEIAVALNVLLGLWVLFTDRSPSRSKIFRPTFAAVLAVGVAAFYFVAAPSWDRRVLTAATYRMRNRIESLDALRDTVRNREFLYYRDGTDATVAIAKDPINRPPGYNLSLLINGKPDASSSSDMQTQLFIAHLPLLIHRDPQDVLVVGLGGGTTLGAASLYPLRSLECIELIPEVVGAAIHFGEFNNHVLLNRAVKVIHQDAKTHLQITDKKYDVIINEPTNPWIAGVSSLFSTEYFQAAKARMKPGGLFLQWFQVYELEDPTFHSMLATVQKTFPYSTLFNFSSADVALIASNEPFSPDFARMERMLAVPQIAADLRRYGVTGPLPLLSMQMINKADTPAPYFEGGRINSDFLPELEYEANRGFFVGTRAEGVKALDMRGASPSRSRLWVASYKPSQTPSEASFAEYLGAFSSFGSLFRDSLSAWVDLWAKYHPDSARMRYSRVQLPRARTGAQAGVLDDPTIAQTREASIARGRLAFRQYTESRSFMMQPHTQPVREAIQRMIAEAPTERFAGMAMLAELSYDEADLRAAQEMYEKAFNAAQEMGVSPEDRGFVEAQLLNAELLADTGNAEAARKLHAQAAAHADGAGVAAERVQLSAARIEQSAARVPTPK